MSPTLLRTSFQKILEREPHLPRRFYDVLFRLHPQLQPLFKSRSRQEQMLARALVAIVDRFEDRPWVDEQLATLGQKHRALHITDAMYRQFTDALMVTLEEVAGDDWTPEIEAAWTSTLEEMASKMKAASTASP
jgi:hemoglobin-like flavoprotein